MYNITPYLKFHPGGVPELMRVAGKEGMSNHYISEMELIRRLGTELFSELAVAEIACS